MYQAYQCVRLGTSMKPGFVVSPGIPLDGAATLTFRAGAWDGTADGTDLQITVSDGFTVAESAPTQSPAKKAEATNQVMLTMEKGAFTDYALTIVGTGDVTVTFAAPTRGRFFLDEVKAVAAEAPQEPVETAITPHSAFLVPHSSYFTLDGRPVNGEPTQKGIYIYKGKKVKK
jgi:hypothetical protein